MSNVLISLPEKLVDVFFEPIFALSVEDYEYRKNALFDLVAGGVSAEEIGIALKSTIETKHLRFQKIIDSKAYKKSLLNGDVFSDTAKNLIGQSLRDSLTIVGRIDQAFSAIASAKYKTRSDPFLVPTGEENQYSFCRTEEGRLRDKSEFKEWVKSTYYVRSLFSNALAHDDLDACELLLERASIRKLIEPDLKDQIMRMGLPPDAACHALVRKEIIGINDYVQSMLAFAKAGDAANVKRIYDASLSPRIGHEIVSLLAYSRNKTEADLMEMLYRDGADWFMGLNQAIHGHAIYFDLKDREIDRLQEMRALLPMISKSKLGGGARRLWRAFPKADVLAIADKEKVAEELHALTEHAELLNKVGKTYKRKLITSDMSL